jgi:hypothetical protein
MGVTAVVGALLASVALHQQLLALVATVVMVWLEYSSRRSCRRHDWHDAVQAF